jgi:hypothetical protein
LIYLGEMKHSEDNILKLVELSQELARIALQCPTCRRQFKQAIENQIQGVHNHSCGHLEGGLMIGVNQSKERKELLRDVNQINTTSPN